MLYQLWLEINRDPAGLGYAGRTDQQIVGLLNAKTRQIQRAILIDDVLKWAAANENLAVILDAISKGSPAKRAKPMVAYELMRNPNVAALDLADSGIKAIFQGLVDDGILLASALTQLVGLSYVQVSRAEELGLGMVEAVHVWQAKREYGGGV